MKEAIILLSHGSKSSIANQELINLRIRLEDKLDRIIQEANLQFGEPNFWDAVDLVVNQGVDRIQIIPLFVFAGRHVRKDIPELIKEAESKYKQIKFELNGHLAADNSLEKIIANKVIE